LNDIKIGTVSITGLAELERRLLDFPDKIARNILGGAIRAGAVVIQKEARQLAPASAEAHWVGKKGTKNRVLIQPGELKRKAIKVRLAPRKKRTVPIEYWVYVARRNWYWRFPEFGTSKRSAQPFMRPAFESRKEAAVERIREYLAARIEKEAVKR
jgi:HK97 gp10 family phage protein